MNKILKVLCSLALSVIVAVCVFQPAFAQQALLTFQSVFSSVYNNAAGQTIVSNASGLPIANPPGGVLMYNQTVDVVAGAGTTQGNAAALSSTKWLHQLTGANGTVGWILPLTTTPGVCHVNLNTTAGIANIYPETGGTINGGATNAVFAALTGIKPIICCTNAASTWICS